MFPTRRIDAAEIYLLKVFPHAPNVKLSRSAAHKIFCGRSPSIFEAYTLFISGQAQGGGMPRRFFWQA
jgi:hypothetical protein